MDNLAALVQERIAKTPPVEHRWWPLSSDEYDALIQRLREAEAGWKKTGEDYHVLGMKFNSAEAHIVQLERVLTECAEITDDELVKEKVRAALAVVEEK